jgi:ketosteroid isomerase-like protein
MKKIFSLLLFISFACIVHAQTADEKIVSEKVVALNKAIFQDKDSVALEALLAKQISYAHSGGKVETRAEMIHGAVSNKSVYANPNTQVTLVLTSGKTIVARHVITATETAADGKVSPLKLGVLQVWVKEKKEWKLFARQAVKLP